MVAGSAPATLTQAPPLPRVVGSATDPPRYTTSIEEISPALLGTIQQIVSATIREEVAALAPTRVATPSDVDAPEDEVEEGVLAPIPLAGRRQEAPHQFLKKSSTMACQFQMPSKGPPGCPVSNWRSSRG
ncbi:UNVERIFIED_CONTAM: hypothetical protein Sradi_2318800 [Sesamum radiatum]|uniref:Uncharacterized protein n=1 Tax=Sesamum radiatum TaxID=300843 RepID=A0AAW2T4W4_SESRA